MPPQPWGCRKSKGHVTPVLEGKRSRKSSSSGFTSFLIASTWRGESGRQDHPGTHGLGARGCALGEKLLSIQQQHQREQPLTQRELTHGASPEHPRAFTWKATWARKMSLSLSKSPRAVYV